MELGGGCAACSDGSPMSGFENLDYNKCPEVPTASLPRRLLMSWCKLNAFSNWLLSTAIHGLRRDEVVLMDVMNVVLASDSSLKYVLILKVDLTSYFRVMPHTSPDGTSTASPLRRWNAVLGSMDGLVYEQISHFTSTVVLQVMQGAWVRLHFLTV